MTTTNGAHLPDAGQATPPRTVGVFDARNPDEAAAFDWIVRTLATMSMASDGFVPTAGKPTQPNRQEP